MNVALGRGIVENLCTGSMTEDTPGVARRDHVDHLRAGGPQGLARPVGGARRGREPRSGHVPLRTPTRPVQAQKVRRETPGERHTVQVDEPGCVDEPGPSQSSHVRAPAAGRVSSTGRHRGRTSPVVRPPVGVTVSALSSGSGASTPPARTRPHDFVPRLLSSVVPVVGQSVRRTFGRPPAGSGGPRARAPASAERLR